MIGVLMGVVIPNGFAQASIVMSLDGKVAPMAMTLGIFSATSLTATQIALGVDQALIAPGSLFATAEVAAMSNKWSYEGVNVTLMTPSGPVLGSFVDVVPGIATQAGLVVNGCLLVKKNTAAGGRKNRGRFFMPPAYLHEINVTETGDLLAPIPLDMQGRFNAFHAALIAEDCLPQLLHSLAAALPPTPITSFTVENRIATQRRRLR